MKLIKRFVTLIVVFLVVLLLCLWLLPGPIIKWAIQSYGSDAVGARVELDSVGFSWFPGRVELRRLAVTNPQAPMTNAVVVENLATEVDLWSALGGKVYLNEVLVEGLAFATPRERSGALPGREPTAAEDTGFILPDLGLPDPATLVEQEKALYKARADAFQELLAQRQQRWQNALAELPDAAALEQYQARWEEARSGNVVTRLQQAKAIGDDLRQDVKRIRETRDTLRQEYRQLQEEYQQLRGLADKSVPQIIDQLGLSDSMVAQLGNQLMSQQVQQWLELALGYYRLLLGGEDAEIAAPETPVEPKTAPDFLARRIVISGPFLRAGSVGQVAGEITNLSDAPALWPEPVTVDIQASGERMGQLQLDGRLQHQQGAVAQDEFSFSIKNNPLESWPLGGGDQLGLMVQQALLSLDLEASVKAMSQLDLKLEGVFSNLDLAQQPATGQWQQSLKTALGSLDRLSLQARADGTLQQPGLKVSSNLNGVLKQALGKELKQRSDALRQQLQQELGQALTEQVGPIEEKVNALQSLPGQADTRLQQFQALLKEVK
ncbi:MAG: hypothetical protein CML06_03900 [Pseudomonadales bacterium]|nr:hypothetical protein [Pseudomonadales bacterium]